MLNLLLGICCLLSVAALVLGIRHTLHMFQLNSYQYQGYGRYMRTHKVQTLFPLVGVALYGVILSGILQKNAAYAVILLFVSTAFFAGLCVLYWPRKAKKKLAVTARVKRLIVTSVLVALLVALLCYVVVTILPTNKGNVWWGIDAAVILVPALSAYIVLLANWCNIPVEKAVKQYYINDAKRLLKACPDLKIIGITGSYGKTSVKYYLHTLLSAGFDVLMTPESYNTPMGVVMTIRGSLKATHQIFLCEMGARHVGDIKEICDIVDPQMGVITSLGYQHLETFKSLENIVGTKKELFDALPSGGPRFINGDNEYVKQFGVNQGAITYGLEEGNTYRAFDLEYSEKGAKFKVQAPDGCVEEYQTKLLGEHNVVNIAGAIAVAHELGIPMEKLKMPVRRLEGAPHRLQPIVKGNNIIIDDAYNSNPNGANMAIKTLGMFKGVRVLVTPGMVELGAQEDQANFELGANATKYCDYIVLVGKKTTESLKKGVESTDFPRDKFYVAENFQDAMNFVYGIQTGEKLIVLLENDLPDNYL